MKQDSHSEMAMELCGVCAAQLKAEGRTVRLALGGSNRKVLCAMCGRKRYGATYSVSKAVGK